MALILLAIYIELSYRDILNLFTLSKNRKDFGRYVLSPRKDLVVISKNPTSVKEWKDQYFFAKGFTELDNGEPSEFFIPRTWGAPGNSLYLVELFLYIFI